MEDKVFYNTCPAAGCHVYCPLKIWVRDGKIRKVEAADYPGETDARTICLKGLSSPRMVYHPDRLKHPLKRVGKRGEGQWKQITWDEALGTIAEKLLEMKREYGPQALKVQAGGSSTVGFLGRLVGFRFGNLWGAGGGFEGAGPLADGGVPAAGRLILGSSQQSHDVQDLLHSKMIILWGWNPAETRFQDMKYILDARDRGAKLVVVGPVFDATAAKADQWIPVRSGTDAALAMAMINVIIGLGAYDADYIAKYTVGPFLVREDSKRFVMEGDKYLVWDKKANAPGACDSTPSPALLGTFTMAGVRCKPAFQLLVERASEYPPEKAAELTGIPAETIKSLAREYATSKPAAIRMHYGMARTFNSNLGCRAVLTLGAITGNIGILGGGACTTGQGLYWIVGTGPADTRIFLNTRGVSFPAGAPGMKKIPGTTNMMKGWAAIRDGKPDPVKALILEFQNPLHTYGHIEGYREIFSQLDLVVVIDLFMTRTAQYADIVLPASSIFEQDEIVIHRDYLLRMEKAIEPLYESKPAQEIWSELGRHVGLGKYFESTPRDYMKIILDTDHPSVAGITLERLEKEKIVRCNVPLTPKVAFPEKKFPTPSGRIEFYQERLLKFGEELPLYKDRFESPRTSPLAKKYPLTFLTIKNRTFTHTMMAGVDWMREVDPEPMLDINPLDARRRSIEDNDLVLVFNDRGKAKLKARLNEAVPPGTINVCHGWWPEQFAEGHYSDLAHRVDDQSIVNPSLDIEPVISDIWSAAHLIYWDCLVEVKKV